MAWIVCADRVLATVEIADSPRARARGLLGRDSLEGAILLRGARSIHTFGMRFGLDVAFCDAELRVLRVIRVPPNRITRPVLRSRAVLEAEMGALARWGVEVGDVLEIRGQHCGR